MRRILRAALLAVVGAAAILLAVSAIAQFIPDEEASSDRPLLTRDERVTVQVLNSGGVDGMARAATVHLRAAGFDVVDVGNGDSFDQDSTVVLDRVGQPRKARAVAEALGVGAVTSEPDAELFLDVTVLLGSDWAAPAPEAESEAAGDGLLDWFRRLVGRWR